MNSSTSDNRDFSTISPSAVSLMYLKALTDIPYAREAVNAINIQNTLDVDAAGQPAMFWGKVLHFESRYKSVDSLLKDISITNILEISSGFSLRGLAAMENTAVHYIDTDLPDVIDTKRKLIEKLSPDALAGNSRLKVMPLNALDEDAFMQTVNLLPPGEIVILNEGLLMYLNTEEKRKLCTIIRKVLQKRGGCWITADVYVKRKEDRALFGNDKLDKFFKDHHIEDNKFDDFESAARFFEENGFKLDKEAVTDRTELSSLNQFLEVTPPDVLEKFRNRGKIQATWRLKAL
ncbi:hypothetical protein [Mucilaginibacter sp. KACC 22063]|uniref:hypothetical protein n=1 Tax=Mucilaginibacter sp. KACC 22063 TaxID=3025666 RepID=UPI00236599FB|nr:hypothetical protein [Mucilaginibacter sp. KACC 22063]WDF56936.1 hypothetical protein PQ461_07695 [Mucilaginibacter sp. KACC 22063]